MNKPSFNHSAIHTDLKKKIQVDTLKSLKEEICEIRPDLYHIPFLVGTHQLVLKVQLPDEFPRSQPLIWIYPTPHHNWVTEQGRIMSPGLVNYTQNSELGCLVHEIIREMRKSITSSNYPIKTTSTEQPALPSGQPIAYSHLFTLPPYIPELESLSGDKIKLLNENKDILDDFTEELPQALEIYKDLDTQQQHLEHLSVTVSDLKRNVNTQRQKIIEHYGVLNQMKEHWDALSGQHQELAQRYLPNNIEASMRSAAALVDEQSEEIAERFLSNQTDVETFLSTYLSTRSLSHLRKAKEEILSKQLQELQRSGYY